jgi:acetylornithine/succinyldiaminopimelate/putrescine aminotransferase
MTVMDVFTPGTHGSTYGGNPMGAKLAIEALAIVKDENGLRLGEGGDFQHSLSYEALKFISHNTVLRSTEPPLLPNRC